MNNTRFSNASMSKMVKPLVKALMVSLSLSVMACQLGGCTDNPNSLVMTTVVKKTSLSIVVPAKGEIVAANSTIMSVPGTARGPQTLSWLLPENTLVKKGDVIARFDGESYVTQRDNTRLDLNSADLETKNKSKVIATEKSNIKSDTVMVDIEIDFSDQFNVNDLSVYSKNQIIDALDNREYLAAQKDFLSWKLDNFSAGSASEMELMGLKARQFQTKLNQFETALTLLEVYAPHDGLLIYERNWRGEKPRIGQALWPSSKLAKLPDLSQLEAHLFVLESEAGSLAVGDKAQVRLDSRTEVRFDGHITKKDQIAKTILTGNPVKYFEFTISLDAPDLSLVQPGNKVTAQLLGSTRQTVLSVPVQAVFSDDNGSFVYVERGGKMVRQSVVLGLKTFAEVEITTGVVEGDEVALFEPVVM